MLLHEFYEGWYWNRKPRTTGNFSKFENLIYQNYPLSGIMVIDGVGAKMICMLQIGD